jgi:hypothetical protein
MVPRGAIGGLGSRWPPGGLVCRLIASFATPWPVSCNYEIRTIRNLPLSGEGGAVERAHPGYRDGAVSGESCDLRDAVRAGRSGDFTRQAVGGRDEGGCGDPCNPCCRGPRGHEGAAPVRRIPGRLHGGRWWYSGLGGVLHVKRRHIRLRIIHRAFGLAAVFNTFDPVRGQSGDHYRCYHNLGGSHEVASSDNGPRCHRRRNGDDLARHAGGRAYRRQTGRQWIPAGYHIATHGLLVLSMGVQFALTGFHAFAP